MTRALSINDYRQIEAAVVAGLSLRKIAGRVGVHRETLRCRMRARGLRTSKERGLLSPTQQVVIEMRAEGMADKEIARFLDISPENVRVQACTANRKIEEATRDWKVFPSTRSASCNPLNTGEEWSAEKTAELRALVEGGMSIGAAGRKMGIGKNAASGKWRRMRK